MNIETIKSNYASMSDERLYTVLTDIQSLREDAVLALKDEYVKRKDNNAIQKIDDYLEGITNSFALEDAKEFLNTSIEEGKSIEVIRLELREKGINIFDILNAANEKDTLIINSITELRQKGAKESEIEEFVGENFELDESEREHISRKLAKTGKQNIIFGSILLTIGISLFIIRLLLNKIPIGGIGATIVGFAFLVTGINQLKKNQE